MRLLSRLLVLALFAFVAFVAFLLIASTGIEPIKWQAPIAPTLESGPFAKNSQLKGIERFADSPGHSPETVIAGPDGRLYTGVASGNILSFTADGHDKYVLSNTGGRPLGLAFHPDGNLIVADAFKGLISISPKGTIRTLTNQIDGQPYGFTDYVAIDTPGENAYFTDASRKWHYGEHPQALLEHGGDGRLLRYHFATGKTEVLLDGLEFANGVVLSPQGDFVLVSESGAYRISRYWLTGDKAGSHDVFVDNLPGFPDNLSTNGKGRIWVAIPKLRDEQLDHLSNWPLLRKLAAPLAYHLPFLFEKPPYSMVLAFNLQGKPVINLQYGGDDAYNQITHVEEVGNWLYFGSLSENNMGRFALPSF